MQIGEWIATFFYEYLFPAVERGAARFITRYTASYVLWTKLAAATWF